ncbi:group 1 truncated hemoglobin [Parendozoicomonas sp. Alg238-R29]|uniref:group I truncated hemoglobin n=1 Tax=Parendozoicomonas sp. Alg238-R29 TaxID=2993446 RepID=UPI00248D587A|nr:group 1 truncated hemoglobin [Parendozoicomonas sp. Alg238-R29]
MSQGSDKKQTLFHRIGGEPAVLLAVNTFYERVSRDPEVGYFFTDLDLDKLAKKQVAFMSMAFEGPVDADVRGLAEAHANLSITDHHFDVVAQHLGETLTDIGVSSELQTEVMDIVEGARGAVLGRG